MYPRLLPRVQASARDGFATAAVELPGSGTRPPIAGFEQARADLRAVVTGGATPDAELIDRLILPLVDRAVPEWRSALDTLLELPELREPVGISGGFISIAVRMARVISGSPRPTCSPAASSRNPSSRRPARSRSRCMSCFSGTTRPITGRCRSTCSTHSDRRKRRWSPTWADTPVFRPGQPRKPDDSSLDTSARTLDKRGVLQRR